MGELARERRNVGDGWQPVIDRIDRGLTELVGEYKVLQIKEKFGGLRFYVELPGELEPEKINAAFLLIYEAEGETFHICEVCGQPGDLKPSRTGWYLTLCPSHWDERDERDRKLVEEMEAMDHD